MKKYFIFLFLLISLFLFTSCNNKTSKSEDTASDDGTKITQDKTEQEADTKSVGDDRFYGTWKIVSCERNGKTYSVDDLNKDEDYFLSHIMMILRADGKYFFYSSAPFKQEVEDWNVTENGINALGSEMILSDNKLSYNSTDFNEIWYFEKTSEDTTFPYLQNISIEKDYLYGTWTVIGSYNKTEKSRKTIRELEILGAPLFMSKLVFSSDNKVFIQFNGEETIEEWELSDNNYNLGLIKAGPHRILFVRDLIYFNSEKANYIILAKTSDDQTIPEISSK